ncbi:phosphatase [Desertibacillus haloalkaliphilus]|uniref:phosphatase n=1 Tax=Desertibacillus haloalkaliphilus TaxID=1328930 RepID=UPI001C25583F|nr:phosphatase [Desertibacillus haloalkaliphilus]
MKNIHIGISLFFVSAILYGATLISASIYAQALAETSWDGRYGIFGTAIREVGTLPLLIATLLVIIGVYFVVQSLRQK